MGKSVPKTSALIVSAIRKLREAQGSTSREIMNFITSEYDVPGPTVKRQLQAALKRGLEYGILKCQRGHYSLSTDAAGGATLTSGEGSLVDKCGRRRKYRKCKKTRRCGRGCVPRRRKRSCGRRARRSRRRRSCRRKCKAVDVDNLALSPADCRTRNDINAQRSNRSSSRSRSRSRSERSSALGVRETSMDRREKGGE